MEHKILLIDDLAQIFRVSPVTIRKWLQKSRKGEGDFILPISAPGAKLRWLEIDVVRYLESKSISPPCDPTGNANKDVDSIVQSFKSYVR